MNSPRFSGSPYEKAYSSRITPKRFLFLYRLAEAIKPRERRIAQKMAQSSSTSSPPTSIEERLRRVEKKVQFMIERENLMDFQSDFKGHGVTNIEERLRHLERKVQFIAERENLMEFQA